MIYNAKNLPEHKVFHSPDGFNWGYAGSGPSELARCLLLEVTGKDRGDGWHYQDFKQEFIYHWTDDWKITDDEIKEWVRQKELKYIKQKGED